MKWKLVLVVPLLLFSLLFSGCDKAGAAEVPPGDEESAQDLAMLPTTSAPEEGPGPPDEESGQEEDPGPPAGESGQEEDPGPPAEESGQEEDPGTPAEESGQEEDPDPPAEESGQEKEVLTLGELIGYFKSLSPQDLGLEGESMDEYQVYPAEGSTTVDGLFCTKLFVYRVADQAGTNAFLGAYLLTRDKSHVYRLDQGTGQVTELHW